MFLVMNNTKNNIVISDINTLIPPNKAVDLDKTVGREKAESSQNLRDAIRSRFIKVVSKDSHNSVINTVTVEKHNSDSVSTDDMRKLIAEEMAKHFNSTPTNNNNQSNDILKAMQMLQDITKNLSSQHLQAQSRTDVVEEDSGIDEKTLADIHAKSVDRLVGKKLEGSIQMEEKKEKDTISKNISELDGLL